MLNNGKPAVFRHTAVLAFFVAITVGAAASAAPAPKSAPAARGGAPAKAEAPSTTAPNSNAPSTTEPTSAAASSTAASSPAAVAAPPVDAAAPPPLSGPQVLQLLDQTIDWYRSLGIEQQTATEPSDLLILYDNRQTASRVLALAFEIARADADMLAKQPAAASGAAADGSAAANSDATAQANLQSLTQAQNKFVLQGNAVQAELADAQRTLTSVRPKDAAKLKAKISELQGELDLINTRKTLIATLMTISNESDANGFSAASLKAQIDAMAITVPSSSGSAPAATAAAARQLPRRNARSQDPQRPRRWPRPASVLPHASASGIWRPTSSA